jgi:protein-S-isoprenylcysteine O-methyltransferase Ste14
MAERRTVRAWLGTIVFLFLAPGIVAGLVPWLITGWRVPDWGGWLPVVVVVAALLILPGIAFLLISFARFAMAGGTPAPPAPTQHLVVEGPYRFVRNPMYLAVAAIILGQVVLFGSWWLFGWLVLALVAVVLFVRAYEEPSLERTYGDEYLEYRANVPGWWPRLRPWRAGD